MAALDGLKEEVEALGHCLIADASGGDGQPHDQAGLVGAGIQRRVSTGDQGLTNRTRLILIIELESKVDSPTARLSGNVAPVSVAGEKLKVSLDSPSSVSVGFRNAPMPQQVTQTAHEQGLAPGHASDELSRWPTIVRSARTGEVPSEQARAVTGPGRWREELVLSFLACRAYALSRAHGRAVDQMSLNVHGLA